MHQSKIINDYIGSFLSTALSRERELVVLIARTLKGEVSSEWNDFAETCEELKPVKLDKIPTRHIKIVVSHR